MSNFKTLHGFWLDTVYVLPEMDFAFMEVRSSFRLQVRGDADLGAVQTLHGEVAEYPAAGICRGPGCQSAQTEEAKHCERTIQDPFLSVLIWLKDCKDAKYIKTH